MPNKNLRLELPFAPMAGREKKRCEKNEMRKIMAALVRGGLRSLWRDQLTVSVTVVECVVVFASVPVPVIVTV